MSAAAPAVVANQDMVLGFHAKLVCAARSSFWKSRRVFLFPVS